MTPPHLFYLVEDNPEFVNKVRNFILDGFSNNDELVTSVITVMEFGVMPERKGQNELILQFKELLSIMNIPVAPVDEKIAEIAYKLRAKYEFLKGMDALQISVALKRECDQFLTNDKKLKRISEIEIVLVDEL